MNFSASFLDRKFQIFLQRYVDGKKLSYQDELSDPTEDLFVSWDLRTSISVLSEVKSRKFAAIHFLMSETHNSSKGNFGASPCFIEMYSCVASA